MSIEIHDIVSGQAATARRQSPHDLAELFLENTKLREPDARELGARINAFFADPKKVATTRQSFKSYALAERVALPAPEPRADGPSFDAVIRGRRSARIGDHPAFDPAPVALAELGSVLFCTYGVTRVDASHGAAANGDGSTFQMPPMRFRTCPSAGGLFPLEVYPLILDVEGVEPGAYHYNAFGHYLERLRPAGDPDEFRDRAVGALGGGGNFDHVGIILAITALPLRSAFKYADRAYRFVLLEAGHAAQNALLGAAALGLAACPIGGFLDDRVDELLGIDGLDELTLHVLALGHPHRHTSDERGR